TPHPRELAVVASGLLVVGLLRCPVTIDDHAADAWLDCRDDRGDPSEKGARRRYSPFAPTSRLPGASTSPLPFRNEKRKPVFKGR
ncbi:MAG TPA: hypothetical protein VJ829_07450, partial [Candidatus Binatia bacterium]|nr:hypothetical protein [Candidatus Binatia bacterium]